MDAHPLRLGRVGWRHDQQALGIWIRDGVNPSLVESRWRVATDELAIGAEVDAGPRSCHALLDLLGCGVGWIAKDAQENRMQRTGALRWAVL